MTGNDWGRARHERRSSGLARRIQRALAPALSLVSAAVLVACGGDSGDAFADAPLASSFPSCPGGLKESRHYYVPPGGRLGSYYSEKGARSLTERICGSGENQTWYFAIEFSDAQMARSYVNEVEQLGQISETPWRPSQPVDYFVRIAFLSSIDECLSDDEGAECTVSDSIYMVVGRTVLTALAEEPAAVVGPPAGFSCGPRPTNPRHELLWEQCLDLSSPRVTGTDDWSGNEAQAERLLAAFVGLTGRAP